MKKIPKRYSSFNKDVSTNQGENMLNKEKYFYDFMSDSSSIQSNRSYESTLIKHQHTIVNMTRHINTPRRMILLVSHIPKIRSNIDRSQSTMLVDRGCDTMMYGQGWTEESHILGQKLSQDELKCTREEEDE